MECWILFDGDFESHEAGAYEVRRFIEAGRRQGINVSVYRPEQFDLIVTRDDRDSVMIDSHIVQLPDFVMTRISADVTYFTLAVIRHLERLGVPCFNGSEAMEAVKDKMHSQQMMAEFNLPVPNTMLAKFPIDMDMVERTIGFPVVVKTLVGTHGSGVFLCDTRDKFNDLMQLINETSPNLHIIFQEFIAASFGRDLRVFVIDGRAVAAMQRKSHDGSFKANYSRGGTAEAFQLTPEIEQLAIESARALNLDIAGIDILFDRDGYQICEANGAPDFRGLETCCNISIADEILMSITNRVASMQSNDVLPFPARSQGMMFSGS
jgi:gamma-F420-2:alpha-L-glutamate ligase